MNLKRTQIYLQPDQHRELKEEAKKLDISLAELLRRIVTEYLFKESPSFSLPNHKAPETVGHSNKVAETGAKYQSRPLEQDLLRRISCDPKVLHGKPCITGTRIPVFVILESLAAGMSHDEIVSEYPPLTIKDIEAALYYASILANEEMLPLGVAR